MTKQILIHKTFLVGVLLKGLNGFLEIIGGIAVLIVAPNSWHQLAKILTRAELIEDPHDFIATFLLNITSHISDSATLFGSIYLLSHGIIKLALIIGLLTKRLWTYPLAMVIFFIFIISQLYYYMHKPSVTLIVLSILDIFVIWLTYLEYRRLKIKPMAN